jgi:hypothetical protein
VCVTRGWRRFGLAVSVAVLAAGAACGADVAPPGPPPPSGQPPAPVRTAPEDPVVRGTGYTFTMPTGWRRVPATGVALPAEAVTLTIDAGVAGPTRTRGVAPMVVVGREPTPTPDVAAVAAAQADDLIRQGLTPSEPTTLTVAGQPALAFEYTSTVEPRSRTRQVVCVRGDTLFVIILTAHAESFGAELPRFDAVLASWAWR